MSKVLKIFVSVMILVIVASISFLTGEVIGMKSGYAHTLKMTTPMDAAYTVSIINLIKYNMHHEAIEMLEKAGAKIQKYFPKGMKYMHIVLDALTGIEYNGTKIEIGHARNYPTFDSKNPNLKSLPQVDLVINQKYRNKLRHLDMKGLKELMGFHNY